MKRRIIIAMSITCSIFILGGTYLMVGMEAATSKLDYVITLHQVEILREQLLLYLKKVQSDLSLQNTPHERSIDTIVDNVRYLEKKMGRCLSCHQSAYMSKVGNQSTNENVLGRLYSLRREIDEYKMSLSRFLTMRANRDRTEIEFDKAFHTTENLVNEVNTMVHATYAKLIEQTESSYTDIAGTEKILYALMVLTPFAAVGLAVFFIRKITEPVNMLLKATRKIKAGDLDYRVEGLAGEFGEVATSFNEMSDSLKGHMRAVEESEKRYRTLFESAGDGIFIVEAQGENSGKIVAANPAAAAMHGYALDELLELNLIRDLDTPEAAEQASERFQRILAGEWIQAEISHRRKDGTVFPVEISAGLLEFMGHKYILAFDRDISERKKLEAMVLQSKTEWEDTFDTITDMITIHDREFNIIRANLAAQKVLGLPSRDNATQAKCYTYYHGEDFRPDNCPSCKNIESGKPASFEVFEPHLNRYLEVRALPRFDDNSKVIGSVHVIRDITERKRVEESMQRAEQLKIVGEWATGLVHEIKNFLSGIKGSVQLLANEENIPEEDKVIIHQAIDEIKRIELLLKSLLNYAKPPKPKLMFIDINELLERTIAFSLRHQSLLAKSPTFVKVLKDFDQDLPKTMADPMQLQQVFLNLLMNAIEAMPGGGNLVIKTSFDAKLKSIQIMISDSGGGIAKDILCNIFQPFFTTKRKGSGLGLAVARRLIEQHGGQIFVESAPGAGSVFNVFLHANGEKK